MTSCVPEAITPLSWVDSRTVVDAVGDAVDAGADGAPVDSDVDGDAGSSGVGEPETAGDDAATPDAGGVATCDEG
jgi:hypothetical protein